MVHSDADDHGEVHINTGTGGARAQQSRPVGGAMAALVSWFVISTGTNTVGTTGRGAKISGGADGATAVVNTNSVGVVNTTGTLSQPWRTAGGAFRDQMLIPRQFSFESGTGAARASSIVIKEKPGTTITFGPGAQIASAGAVIAHGAAAVITNHDAAVNIYRNQSSNIYWSVAIVGPMIGFGLGIVVCSSKKLGAGVMVTVGFSVKRKVRCWAARLLKKIKND